MTESDFLRAICSSPADDLPRQMYADWLEENAGEVECGACKGKGKENKWSIFEGNWYELECPTCSGSGRVSDGRRERAEFIRCQIEIANQGECTSAYCCQQGYDQCRTCKDYEALRQRERELWNHNGLDWVRDLPGGPKAIRAGIATAGHRDDVQFAFGRGFISTVSAPLAALIGGPCERCDGDGWFGDGSGRIEPCPAKCGAGIASRLIGVQPVERWVATDKRPLVIETMNRTVARWYIQEDPPIFDVDEDDLPKAVFDRLEDCEDSSDEFYQYDSEASALEALSRAVDAIAREQAGKGQPSPAPAPDPRTFQPLLA